MRTAIVACVLFKPALPQSFDLMIAAPRMRLAKRSRSVMSCTHWCTPWVSDTPHRDPQTSRASSVGQNDVDALQEKLQQATAEEIEELRRHDQGRTKTKKGNCICVVQGLLH